MWEESEQITESQNQSINHQLLLEHQSKFSELLVINSKNSCQMLVSTSVKPLEILVATRICQKRTSSKVCNITQTSLHLQWGTELDRITISAKCCYYLADFVWHTVSGTLFLLPSSAPVCNHWITGLKSAQVCAPLHTYRNTYACDNMHEIKGHLNYWFARLTNKALMSSSGSGGSPAGVLGDSVTCNSFIPSLSTSTSVSDFLRSLIGDLDLPLATLLGVLSTSGLTHSTTTFTFFLGGDPSLWVAPSVWNHIQNHKMNVKTG